MKSRALWAACVVGVLLGVAARGRAGEPVGEPPPADERYGIVERLKQPCEWLCLGGDVRVRYTYLKNEFDFENNGNDNRSFFRFRGRIWTKAGPFFQDADSGGLTLYTRLTSEPRYIDRWNGRQDNWIWDEVIVDNLWAEWRRINGLPITIKIGRQDLFYGNLGKGRGLVLVDHTVFEGSRTLYSDAIKATIHLDAINGTLDLIAMDHRADQSRFSPLGREDGDWLISEYDHHIYAAYLRAKPAEGHEVGAYYIYKDETPSNTAQNGQIARGRPLFRSRRVHTVGIPLVGEFGDGFDYYLEGAWQWGTEAAARRRGYALSSDFGYTFRHMACAPRIHAGCEFLSGDDPTTARWEGWDPVMSRWPQWSELLGYRWAVETGMPFYWTNMERYTVGASFKPLPAMGIYLDHSLVRGRENMAGALYGTGDTRGTLTVAKMTYKLSKSASMHLWTEWFHPMSYYVGTADSALFLRTQFVYMF